MSNTNNYEEISSYLNHVKTNLNMEIENIIEVVQSIDLQITKQAKETLDYSNEIIKNEERIKEIDHKIKKLKEQQNEVNNNKIYENDDLEVLQNEKDKFLVEISDIDSIVLWSSMEKTTHEQNKSNLSTYKVSCEQLIETIDLHLECPEEYSNSKDEIKNDLNKLYNEFVNLKIQNIVEEHEDIIKNQFKFEFKIIDLIQQ